MELITILNQCHRYPGFVYQQARFGPDKKSIEIDVRPRDGSTAVCSGCHQPAPGYDHLPERRFEFIPLWGFLVFLLYRMRRVDCRTCGVGVEEVPWGDRQAPVDQSLHAVSGALGAQALLEGNRRGVPHLLGQGLRRGRVCGRAGGWSIAAWSPIRAIGVDEIQYAKGHKYLTLVYQIDQGLHPPAVDRQGTHRRIASRGFFTLIGENSLSQIEFVCSDMWKPYLE